MKKTWPLVSIIMVNYNGKRYLKGYFTSLLKLRYPKNKIEIIMIDNCSTDGSAGFVRRNFPNVKVIKNNVNNYARANNLGARKAKGEFISFVNNDIEANRDWLTELVKAIRMRPRVGVAGGKILLKDNKIHSAGHEEYPDFYWGDRGFRQQHKGQYKRMEEVSSLCGAAILFRKTCLNEIGPFDEDFVMYLEDIDMCFRCAKKKWKILYAPKAIARHHFRGSSSEELVRYFSERNRLLLVAKHFPKQLGKALYGKGYFTGGEKNLYDILPLILAKFLECHEAKRVASILPSLFKNLKKISNLEKSIVSDRIYEDKNAISQKETLADELIRTNAQLREQIQKASKDIESKDKLLHEKEIMSLEIHGQIQKASKDIESRDSMLGEKESLMGELTQANAQLHSQIQKISKDVESKDKLLHEKEVMFLELRGQIQKASKDIESRDSMLRGKEEMSLEIHAQIQKASK
ncbi:MAG: glycosyltransferase, partial [Candidatus Gorgyraea atricola]|nr:glycosyltransferase [Candidatus Gorgyraea atricola]